MIEVMYKLLFVSQVFEWIDQDQLTQVIMFIWTVFKLDLDLFCMHIDT